MKSTLCAACAAFAMTSVAIADTTMDFDGQGGDQPEQILISNGKVMMRSSDGEDVLYDQRNKRLAIIVHEERAYFLMDPDTMSRRMESMKARSKEQLEKLQAELGPAMEKMRKEMQAMLSDPKLPQSQKRMIEQQLAGMAEGAGGAPAGIAAMPAPQPMSTKVTGETRKIVGSKCAVHLVSQGANAVEEVCVAARADVGIPENDYRTMRSMFAFMRDLTGRVAGFEGGYAMPDFDGVPVQIRDLEDGSVSTLRAISTRKIDASALAIPAGYQEQDPFE